jgi:Na+/proline symporter
MVIILGIALFLAPWAIHEKGFTSLMAGLGGISHQYGNLFDDKGIEVMMSFGISSAIGLLSGPFGDQSFWQRAFSVKKEKLGASFAIGAILFAIVPLMMGTLGFVAAGIGLHVKDTQVVNLALVSTIFPKWAMWLFLFMVLSGLLSTVSSQLCSISSLANDMRAEAKIRDYKLTMLIQALLAIAIANIPGLTIVHLFLFYGTLRASTFATTVLTLLGVELTERGVFYGVLASLVIGWPIFAYGNLFNDSMLKVVGSLATLLLSGIVAFSLSRVEVRNLATGQEASNVE